MNKKVAFITASSSGIGKDIAFYLLEKGYIVYINGRDKDKLNKLKIEFNNEYLKEIYGDMTIEENIIFALAFIEKQEKRLDLVVCNLGSGKSILGYDVDILEYKRVFDINLFGAISLATKAIELLKNTRGNIVFISSITGCESIKAPIPYTTAKTALLGFSKALSFEVAKYNIRVNCISPGNVLFNGSTWDKKMEENKENVLSYISDNVPLNDFAKPSDISKAVYFLEESDFITGSNIVVDGGQIKKII